MKQKQKPQYKKLLNSKRLFAPYSQVQAVPVKDGEAPAYAVRLYGHGKELKSWTVIKKEDLVKALALIPKEEVMEDTEKVVTPEPEVTEAPAEEVPAEQQRVEPSAPSGVSRRMPRDDEEGVVR